MIVESLHVYPLKSGRASGRDEVAVDALGLAGDRRLMVVDPSGHFLSLRGLPRLSQVEVTVGVDDVVARAPGMAPITVALAGVARMQVEIWGEHLEAVLLGPALDAWISAYLETPAHVVRIDDIVRVADPTYASPGDVVAFADGFSLLVTCTASLDALNAELERPVSMGHFRPNIVIRTSEPWAEDHWRRVRIGPVELALVKPCGRCVAINVDPETGHVAREPLRTLSQLRTFELVGKRQVVFGQNAVARGVGHVRVGDPVVVLETIPESSQEGP